MTKQQLETYIKKIIREEVQRAVQNMKTEILSELRSKPTSKPVVTSTQPIKNNATETSITKNFIGQYRPKTNPQVKYSNNSFLNELLSSTQPLQSDMPLGYDDEFDDMDIPQQKNIVTADINGMPINENNSKVRGVMDIMNRDYSALVKKLDNTPVKVTKSVGDDEDLSWLNSIG